MINRAKIVVGTSLACFVSQFFSNTKMLPEVLYGLIEVTQLISSEAKIVVGTFLACPVSQFFSNTKMLFVVLYGFIEITQFAICRAKIVVGRSLTYPVSQFFCIEEVLLYYLNYCLRLRFEKMYRQPHKNCVIILVLMFVCQIKK